MNQRIKITKRMLGGYTVKYDCPNCNTRLSSSLKDAGLADNCPDCSAIFVVPGQAELAKLTAEKELENKNKELAYRQRDEQKQSKKREKEQRAKELVERRKAEAAEATERVIAATSQPNLSAKEAFNDEPLTTNANTNKQQNETIVSLGCLSVICVALIVLCGMCGGLNSSPPSQPRRTNPYSEYYTDRNYNPNKTIRTKEEADNAIIQELIRHNREEQDERRIWGR